MERMAKGYGQYCPLALAAELLTERWTILVVSRLIDGCTTFNEIHRGVPRISPSLLSKRLSELAAAGLVVKRSRAGRGGPVYELTAAGRALSTVVDEMAVWGQQWARDMTQEDLDPGFLAWSMHTRMNVEAMPPGRTVVEFNFTGAPPDCRCFWLINEDGVIDMCLKHPGFEPDVTVNADLRTFIETWRGFRNLRTEIRAGRIRVEGPRELTKAFPDWLLLSGLAKFQRKRPGKEKTMSSRRK